MKTLLWVLVRRELWKPFVADVGIWLLCCGRPGLPEMAVAMGLVAYVFHFTARPRAYLGAVSPRVARLIGEVP